MQILQLYSLISLDFLVPYNQLVEEDQQEPFWD